MAIVAAAALQAGTASAATSCTYDPATRHVAVRATSQRGEMTNITVQRHDDRILVLDSPTEVNEVRCGAATVRNTDSIGIDASSDRSVAVFLDPFEGAFGPGATPEGDRWDEIEITASLHGPTDGSPHLGVFQVSGRRTVARLGARGIDVTGDGDVDVIFDPASPLPDVEIEGTPYDDVLSAAGGAGTGAPWPIAAWLFGGDGDDRLEGGAGADIFLSGGAGRDTLVGGSGGEYLEGGSGRDRVTGGAGEDHLSGGVGADVIDARDGGADWVDGGPASDVALVDPGREHEVRNVEDVR